MSIVTKFKSTIPSLRFVCKNGFVVNFLQGEFHTQDADIAKEVQAQADNVDQPYIYVDAEDATVDTEALSPYELLVQAAKRQALAELAAAGQLKAPDTTSNQGNFADSINNTAKQAEAAELGSKELAEMQALLEEAKEGAEATVALAQAVSSGAVKVNLAPKQ
jgi:hypothetical protein